MPILSCPHCGLKNRTGSNFCNQCGARLSDAEPEAVEETTVSPEPAVDSGQTLPSEGMANSEFPGYAEEHGEPPAEIPLTPVSTSTEQPSLPEEEAEKLEFPEPEAHQPWLRSEPLEAENGDQLIDGDARLFSGLQGLLDPLPLVGEISLSPVAPGQAVSLDADYIRHYRSLAGSGLALTEELPVSVAWKFSLSRHPMIFMLVGLVLLIPVLLQASSANATPHRWSGVTSAYDRIAELTSTSVVLVNWAYDPATAGEMDLVALPVVTHLLAGKSQLVAVSQLPGGLATGRRLLEQAVAEIQLTRGLIVAQDGENRILVEAGFLPGGPAALPLIGQDPVGSVAPNSDTGTPADSLAVRRLAQQPPTLAIVLAAQAEDVQDWLEQVQPLDGTPVVAVTSASADLILRPYLDSGQLAGLVSGFDGAYHYQNLIQVPASRPMEQRLQLHVVAQEWGGWLVLGILVAGNLAALWRRAE